MTISINSTKPGLVTSSGRGRLVIGIDIGAGAVRVAELAFNQGKVTVIKVIAEPVGTVFGEDKNEAVTQALKNALAHFDTGRADIICTVPHQKAGMEYLTMPLMPDAELAQAVKIEINNSSYTAIEEPFIDYEIAGRVLDKNVEKMNVRVALIAKSAIDSVLSYFKSLDQPEGEKSFLKFLRGRDFMRLNLVKLVPVSIALEGVIQQSTTALSENLVVLEMGSTSSELSIFHHGKMEFSRKINVTGFDFTRSLTSALSTSTGKVELTLEEAELVKKEYGIPSAGEEYLIKGKITANQAVSLLRPKLEQLIKEITRTFDFYYDKNRSGKLDRMALVGGGTMLKRLPEFLNAELGLPVGSADFLRGLDLPDQGLPGELQDNHRVLLCIGAALSGPKGINLLPEQFRSAKNKFFLKMAIGLAGMGFLVVSILIYILLLGQLQGLHEESLKLEHEYDVLRPGINDIKDHLLIQHMAHHRIDLSGLLRELSYLPPKVYLTDLDFSHGELTMTGTLLFPERESKKILKPLIADLKSIALQDVKIESIKEDQEEAARSNFLIKADWKPQGGP